MKKLTNILAVAILAFSVLACGDDENEAVPEFLDGTQYGVLLHVDITSSSTIAIADVATASLDFDVSFEGDKRPVSSIVVTKAYVPSGGASQTASEQMNITSFPASVSMSVNDLIAGVAGLTASSDLQVGDEFAIKFIITYADGGVVTRYGTLNNPNFTLSFN